MKVYDGILDLVGNTPLIKITRVASHVAQSNILAKLEYYNPSKSVKDRAAFNMIREAERCGTLTRDSIIVEATSGNTGIALATIAAAKGYRLKLVIPDTMSVDKINQIRALGAEVVLTPGLLGMKKAYHMADKILEETPGGFVPNQMKNPANPKIHFDTTAEEIWNDTDGKVDIFVAGIGTGGTISGTARKLKQKNPSIKVYGFEPKGSPVINGGNRGPHKIQGVGAGFIPDNLDLSVIDEVLTVEDDDAMIMARRLAREEGVFVGISSGAAMDVALRMASRAEHVGKLIVALFPDTGERYLNTELYNANIKDDFVA